METNNLKFRTQRVNANGETVIINIRLNDECKNGHEDFAITGSVYEKGKQMTERNCYRAGAIGDDIAKWFPEYKIFNDLHLNDFKGAPMYANANGFYHIKNCMDCAKFMQYFNCTEEEYKILFKASEQKEFDFLLASMPQIAERWQDTANKAIEQLEQLTGDKFISTATKCHYTPIEITQEILQLYTDEYLHTNRLQKGRKPRKIKP